MESKVLHRASPKLGYVLATLTLLWSLLSGTRAEAFPAEPLILYAKSCVYKTMAPETRAVRIEAFKAKYLRSFAKNADNEKFYREVTPVPKDGSLFYHVDNVLLKQLSEVYFADREIIAAVEGLFTSILFENLRQNKKLMAELTYSDYKTTRLGFAHDTPELRQELVKLHDETAREFGYAMWHHRELRDFYATGPGPIAQPESWHMAGIAKTPDNASAVSRYGRYLYKEMSEAHRGHVPLLDYDNEHTYAELTDRFDHVELTRAELQKSLETAGESFRRLLDYKGVRGRAVLSREAVEILRRLQPAESRADYFDQLKEAFEARFGGEVEISTALLQRMLNYSHAMDTFMPSIYEPGEMMDFGFSRATHGSVMFDVAGQNARNIVAAMKSLAGVARSSGKSSTRLDLGIRRAREGQQEASAEFEKRRARVPEAIAKLGFNPKEVLFSGDDGIFLPDRSLTAEQKKEVLRTLRDLGGAGEYRVTFLPSRYFDKDVVIPPSERSAIVSNAEAIEKKARVNLELGKIPYAELKEMLFAVDIDPASDGRRKVRIYVSGVKDEAAFAKIREAVKAVIPENVTIESIESADKRPALRRPNQLDDANDVSSMEPLHRRSLRREPRQSGQLSLRFAAIAAA